MGNVSLRSKIDTPEAFANLARSYRLIARFMVTQKSRDQLLRMADVAEQRSRRHRRSSKNDVVL